MANALIAAGADVGVGDEGGLTPLHMAANGHTEVARVLISAGADVNAADVYGKKPLHIANHHETAQTLIAAGAKY